MKILSLIFATLVLSGCASQITRYGYKSQSLQNIDIRNSQVAIKNNFVYNKGDVEILGKIKARDAGFAVRCGEEYVLGIFCSEAHALGADIINIIWERQPNPWGSSCYRAEAEFLRLKNREKVAGLSSDPQYSYELVKKRSEKTKEILDSAINAGIEGGTTGGVVSGITR